MPKKFTSEEIREILRKYRLGQCTSEESQIIERWYRSFDDEEVNSIDLENPERLHELKVQMLEEIDNKIILAEQGVANTRNKERPVRKLYFVDFENLKRIAAVLVVGTTLGMFFYGDRASVDLNAERPVIIDKDYMAEGPRATSPATIYLSDGSVVWLKGESRLEYPENFLGDTREVTLIGEAFFDVAKDRKKPFIIHSTNFTTRVLGTSFNIRAYGSDDAQEVLVVTGEVVVSVKESSGKPAEVVLSPNQKAVYSRKENSLVAYDAEDRVEYSTFNTSKLVFDEVSLGDIVKVLNAEYDTRILLANDEMEKCIITADLTSESLEVGVEILSRAINATVTTDGKNIVLSGSGCIQGMK